MLGLCKQCGIIWIFTSVTNNHRMNILLCYCLSMAGKKEKQTKWPPHAIHGLSIDDVQIISISFNIMVEIAIALT